jgi:release factor glutamine methyltransferase
VTVAEAQDLGCQMLRRVKIESYRIDSSLILAKVLDKPRAWLFAHPEHALTDDQAKAFMELIDRRRQRTPLVHLTNQREFYGLDLYIDERVLTPRVETEQMVEWAISYAPRDSRLIDVGTGSGALAIAIKKHRPDLEVWATDVSAEALEVAQRNATAHKVEVHFETADLFDAVSANSTHIPLESPANSREFAQAQKERSAQSASLQPGFQTVVTNLPYLQDDAELMPEVQKEPGVALFGGQDGLDLYRRFLRQLPDHLEPRGYLFTECDPWQHEALIKEAAAVGLKPIEQGYFILGFQRD